MKAELMMREKRFKPGHPLYFRMPYELLNLKPYCNTIKSSQGNRVESIHATWVKPTGHGVPFDKSFDTYNAITGEQEREDTEADTIMDQMYQIKKDISHIFITYSVVVNDEILYEDRVKVTAGDDKRVVIRVGDRITRKKGEKIICL